MSHYHSQTHGPIPLSMEARKLMVNLRNAISMYRAGETDWMPVAHARGELAQYMSTLERMKEPWREKHYKPEVPATMRWNQLPWYSGTVSGRLTGKSADMIILDDPQNLEKTDMAKKKADAARKKAAAKFRTVGVRFLQGGNLAKIYTYKIKRSAKVHLGQELVVTNDNGVSVVVVVQMGPELAALGYTMEALKEITAKVAAL
jgi:hypothetical protein